MVGIENPFSLKYEVSTSYVQRRFGQPVITRAQTWQHRGPSLHLRTRRPTAKVWRPARLAGTRAAGCDAHAADLGSGSVERARAAEPAAERRPIQLSPILTPALPAAHVPLLS